MSDVERKPVDERFTLWQRNVIDKFKDISTEDIKTELQKTALPGGCFMNQIEGDFNFSNVIRTANAFNMSKVFYYGKKRFDRRGTMGTHHYTDVQYLSSVDDIKKLKDEYRFVGLENNITKPTIDINRYKFAANSIIIIGEENAGLTNDILDLCDDLVEIPTFGSVRSLNAATAAAIAMNIYSSQIRK